MVKEMGKFAHSVSSGSTVETISESRPGTYQVVIPLDSSSRSPIIFPGKSVVYNGNEIKTIVLKYNPDEEIRRNRILIRNGVIPATPESDKR